MKYALAIGFGFWLGRKFYLNYTESEARHKEKQLIKKLTDFLEQQGLSQKEAKEEANLLLNKNN